MTLRHSTPHAGRPAHTRGSKAVKGCSSSTTRSVRHWPRPRCPGEYGSARSLLVQPGLSWISRYGADRTLAGAGGRAAKVALTHTGWTSSSSSRSPKGRRGRYLVTGARSLPVNGKRSDAENQPPSFLASVVAGLPGGVRGAKNFVGWWQGVVQCRINLHDL